MMRVLMVDAVTGGVIVRNAAHHLLLADLRRLLWAIRYDRSAFTSAG